MSFHLGRLTDKVVAELIVAKPVDRVNKEDLASDQCTLDLIHKFVVPPGCWLESMLFLPRRLSSISIAVFHHLADNTERIGDDSAFWWPVDVDLATQNKNGGTDNEHAETHSIGGPETLGTFHD